LSSGTLVIISGASRGLGAALTRLFLAEQAQVIALARKSDAGLTQWATQHGASLTQSEVDLSTDDGAQSAARQIETALKASASSVKRVILINNAGAVDPVNVAHAHTDAKAITHAFALNVTAPIVLTAAVLSNVDARTTACQILNISSGAGRNPSPGWSVYCATKAALDMATRVLNVEQTASNVRAVALAPGVIDTDMQINIRSKDQAKFPVRDKFLALHADGKLSSPDNVALRIRNYLNRDDFGTIEIDDIRNYD